LLNLTMSENGHLSGLSELTLNMTRLMLTQFKK
jgi:hypothetical protein